MWNPHLQLPWLYFLRKIPRAGFNLFTSRHLRKTTVLSAVWNSVMFIVCWSKSSAKNWERGWGTQCKSFHINKTGDVLMWLISWVLQDCAGSHWVPMFHCFLFQLKNVLFTETFYTWIQNSIEPIYSHIARISHSMLYLLPRKWRHTFMSFLRDVGLFLSYMN